METDDERVEFMEIMKKRIDNLTKIRSLLSIYSEIKIRDNERYVDIDRLEVRMHDKLNLKILDIKDPENEIFFPKERFEIRQDFNFEYDMKKHVPIEGWDY